MSQELIRLIQAPIIEERLRVLKAEIAQMTAEAMSLVCTEETVQAVKATRSDLKRQFSELEEQRKAIKAAVLDPYNRFEVVYRECVSDAFEQADADLKQKISDVESDMKRRCEDGLREYFAELCAVHHIDFVAYEQAGILVSMADARAKTQPPKKLREQLAAFVQDVAETLQNISGMAHAEEILVEYKQTLQAAVSISTVQERHRRIEAEQEAQAALAEVKAHEAEAVKKVEAFAPPVEVPAAPDTARVTFTIVDTVDRLKLLKQFLVSNGYKYE